jgi:hypothetical protein
MAQSASRWPLRAELARDNAVHGSNTRLPVDRRAPRCAGDEHHRPAHLLVARAELRSAAGARDGSVPRVLPAGVSAADGDRSRGVLPRQRRADSREHDPLQLVRGHVHPVLHGHRRSDAADGEPESSVLVFVPQRRCQRHDAVRARRPRVADRRISAGARSRAPPAAERLRVACIHHAGWLHHRAELLPSSRHLPGFECPPRVSPLGRSLQHRDRAAHGARCVCVDVHLWASGLGRSSVLLGA